MNERRPKGPARPADPLERVTSRREDAVEKLAPAGIFGYAAGKSIIAKKLVKLFPSHGAYVEPFCGSAALYFTKEAVPTEVLNDRDEEVIFSLKMVKSMSKGELDTLAKKNWVGSAETFNKLRNSSPTDKIDRLYKFLYLVNFSYGKGRRSFNPGTAGASSTMAKRIEKFQPRMKNTILLSGDYEKAIKDYDGKEAFHFLDPPYAGYKAGGGGVGEKEFDEGRFRKMLENLKGQFLVTYGVKGKLDTSGFEVKRMRQPRTIRFMRGASQDKFLTHLLISNFKVTKKSLGSDIALDDVTAIIDTDDGGERIMVTGSRTSVSVPEALAARAWKHEDPLRTYPEDPAPVPSLVQARFLDKRCEVDLLFEVAGQPVAWTFDLQRADAVGDPRAVAKTFAPEGSRFFAPLAEGVPARPMVDAVATELVKIDRPMVELGMQTDSFHEYFLTKGDELSGVLHLERAPELPLGAKIPWLATFYDRYPTGTDLPVLKAGAPMPPDGISALPESLERAVPIAMRYWEKRGEEAVAARDALAASRLLAPENVAIVDGEFCRIAQKVVLDEAVPAISNDPEWALAKAVSILPDGVEMVEVFGPGREALAKADGVDRAVYCDGGEAIDGTLDLLAKALLARAGHYVVSAVDSPDARAALAKMGRVFTFRPGADVGLDAPRRLFVASFPVRADVTWLTKFKDNDDWWMSRGDADGWAKMSPWARAHAVARAEASKAEWTSAYVNDLPDSAFLFLEDGGEHDEDGKTKPRSLRHFPYKDKDGKVDVAHARNAIARIPQSNAHGLTADKKQALQDKARHLLEEAEKARPKPTLTTPSDDTPDLGKCEVCKNYAWLPDMGGPVHGHHPACAKADLASGDLADGGRLLPGQKKPRYASEKALAATFVSKAEDEQIVYGIVLEPDTVDAQDDIYSAEEVRNAAHKYMEDFQNAGLMHRRKINDKAKVIESYLAPDNFSIGGQKVKKGTWVMAMRVMDETIWKQVKSGDLTGFSIGGSAQRTPEATAKAMRRTDYQGIPITIDRPKGYIQHGRDAQGQPWEREYKVDYGYIPRTKGGDGEGVDVFLGPKPESDTAFWIAQKKADGSFDEYKVMLGFGSPEEARTTYLDHVPETYFGEMFPVGIEQMKALLNKEPAHAL